MKHVLVVVLRAVNRGVRALAALTHYVQFLVEWGLRPLPEWYDHQLDVYWQWPRRRSSFFIERGVFGSLAMEPGDRVLELCCGDGFNAGKIYASIAGDVLALDFDAEAIAYAARVNPAPNVRFLIRDIRDPLPDGPFDVVTWDAAIEHFTLDEIDRLLTEIRRVLAPSGVLSGYTIAARSSGGKYLEHHEHEFSGSEELHAMITAHFAHAWTFSTVHPQRTNLYFWASMTDQRLPFSDRNARFRHSSPA